jgi:serine/threonine-protein kinase
MDSRPAGLHDKRLAEIAFAYLDARDRGPAPSAEDLLARYPEYADALASFLADQEAVDRLAQPLRAVARAAVGGSTADPHETVATADGSPVETRLPLFGDYEILEELARGGMGVVYRARQRSLNRPVALKVIRSSALASAEDARRFRNEAETVAVLDHPNIVPVYEVGEDDGRLYFSMKLVEGGSLAGQLGRFGADPKAAAGLLVALARAVHHAHQRGVLHRDLKPSNILLDGEGRPHVTDFGLAKRVATDSSLTHSGAVLGTPSYMAPEQASGQKAQITTATDVYGLGAVLYALLTGRPPFRSDDVLETLDDVKHREPEHPRRSNPAIDRDLQTISLKCLQKEPARRYATAEDLAQDLESWLAGKPIQARAIGRPARLWRWCRRNPTVAALTGGLAVVLVLGLVGAVVSYVLLWQAKGRTETALDHAEAAYKAEVAERRRADQAYANEVRERKRAQAHLALGLKVLDDLYVDAAAQRLPRARELLPEDRKLLQKALAFYEQYARQDSDDPDVQDNVADARRRVGLIRIRLGDYAKAEEALREAVNAFDQLAKQAPTRADYRASLAQSLNNLAVLLDRLGRRAEEETVFKRTIGVRRALLDERPTDPDLQHWLAGEYDNLATLLHRNGRGREAGDAEREALKLLEQAVARRPRHAPYRRSLGIYRMNMGVTRNENGERQAAEKSYREALNLFQGLKDDPARELEDGTRLVHCYNNLGISMVRSGQPAEAEKLFMAGVAEAENLVNKFPALPDYQSALADSHHYLANVRAGTGRLDDAERAFRASVATWQKLARTFPNVPGYRDDLAAARRDLMTLLLMRDRYGEVDAEYRAALLEDPDQPQLQEGYARFLASYPDAHYRDAARAVGLAKKAVTRDPGHGTYWNTLGLAHYRVGEWDAAIAALQQSMKLRKGGDGFDGFVLAMAEWQRGNKDKARWWYAQSVNWMKASAAVLGGLNGIEATRLRAEAAALLGAGPADQAGAQRREAIGREQDDAKAHNSRGAALIAKRHLDEAVAEFRKAIRLKADFISAHHNLACVLMAQGRREEAITEFRAVVRLKPDDPKAHGTLGHALLQAGQFQEAVAALRRGDEIGRRDPHWSNPSAQTLREAETMARLDAGLPALLKGDAKPADTAERLALAQMCQNHRTLYVAAARWYEEAFVANPALADDQAAGHRYNAACAAALAGCGRGNDAGKLAEPERVRLRKQALAWLRADLAAWRRVLKTAPANAPAVAQTLQHWLADSDFDGVRGVAALGHLPEGERRDWQRFWQEVEELRRQASTARPTVPARPGADRAGKEKGAR